jgi:hypothetical protein
MSVVSEIYLQFLGAAAKSDDRRDRAFFDATPVKVAR